MNIPLTFRPSKKMFASFLLMALSVVLAAYGPLVSVSRAQAVTDDALQTLKQKAIDELNRRITNYEKTLKTLNVDFEISKDGSSLNVSSEKSATSDSVDNNSAFTMDENGLKGHIELAPKLKEKVVQFMKKIVEELKTLQTKVKDTTSLSEMKSLASNIEAQFKLDQLTQVQSSVTQAVESMTGVLDNLKTTFNGLKSQVTKLKDCAKNVFNGDGSVKANASASGADVSCGEFNLSSSDVANQAQSQMASVQTIIQTISSVLLSCVTLLTTLVGSFTSLTGGLGSLGSLGNLGNLSSLTGLISGLGGNGSASSLGDLSSLTGSLGSISGIMSSFTAILSQLDLSSLMSNNALGSLTSLTSLINI